MKLLSRLLLMLFALATSSVAADPRTLSDQQMDQITAGTAGEHTLPTAATGGNIISGEAHASIAGESTISLLDNAQTGASALSLVSSADSAVASGVNLWDGTVQTLNVGSEINVLQSNELAQNSASPYAWLHGYDREEGTLRDVSTYADSTAEVQKIEFGLQLDIDGIGTFNGAGEVPAAVIPGAKIPGTYGNVVGFAGELGIEYDGGSFEAGFDLDSSLAAEAHLNAASTTSILWGLIDVAGGDLKSRTRVTGSFNPYITIDWVFPDLSISGEGAVCYANAGVCRSSVLDRHIAALYMPVANAEYIVIDRSGLDASSVYEVTLGTEAQAMARAVTLVNSAGGLVANGANLATASDAGFGTETDETASGSMLATDVLFLDQDNLLTQTRGVSDSGRRGRHPSNPGGTIVAAESMANQSHSRSVTATDAAQADARAVTLANSADALIATGVNVWDGRLQEGVVGNRVDMWQNNRLTQHEGQNSASLAAYERGPESLYHAWTSGESASKPKSLGTEFTLVIPSPDPDAEKPVASLTGNLSIPASIIPTSKIPGLGGTTAAFAGNVDAYLDGGTADFGFGIEESDLHFMTRNSVTGGGDLGLFSVETDGRFRNDTHATIDAALDLHIEMPDLDVEVDGTACFAQKGTCEAGLSDRDIGSLDLFLANAEYIVLDRSMLDVANSSTVTLDSGAQAGVRAVNLFNAAGGSIAGGTNIASWRGDEMLLDLPLLNLAQENDVMQTPGYMGRHSLPGGVIVAYESTASVADSASVDLMNDAQRGAHALNLVNSADALVANGLNLWAGNLTAASFEDSINVMQSNVLVQTFPGPAARMGAYYRDEQWARDVHTYASTKSPDPPDPGIFPPAKPGLISGAVELDIPKLVEYERTGWVPTSIIPTSKIPGGKPGALAVAGDAFFHYDGGGVELTTTTGNHFSTSTRAKADGKVEVFFGLAEGSGETKFREDSVVDVTTNLFVDVDLPDLTIDVSGAGCIVKGADCTASTVERMDGPLLVGGAAAEFIVVDRSALSATTDYSVTLGDHAQAEARALLVVNAAGGHVANGLNVSRLIANNLSAQPNLAQANLVLQGVTLDGETASHSAGRKAPGGTVVAGESVATLDSGASVSLDTNAQDSARALLLVNAADALVGNGINVWSGDLDEADFGHAINLAQTNQVLQYVAPTTARLFFYDRDDSYLRHVYSVADSRAEPQYIRGAFDINIPDVVHYYEGLIVPAAAIPNSKIPGARGMVTGFAGTADVVYGGGSVDVDFGIDAHLGHSSKLSTDAAVRDFLGFGTSTGHTEFGIDEFTVDFEPTLFIRADLPTLEIKAEGALCWANGGTCSAGIREEDRGELSIVSAQAENVAVDKAVLDVTESYSVALGNSAQAHAQAMAIVNAAGGLVANGINVSNLQGAATSTSSVNVVQRNVIVQGD